MKKNVIVITSMYPNGEKAPPALAATTIFMHAKPINFVLFFPTAITTAHIINAVVRLSAMGDIKNDKIPVIQNIFLKVKPWPTNQDLNASKTFLSVIEFIKVIATNKNPNNSANSKKVCLKAYEAEWTS